MKNVSVYARKMVSVVYFFPFKVAELDCEENVLSNVKRLEWNVLYSRYIIRNNKVKVALECQSKGITGNTLIIYVGFDGTHRRLHIHTLIQRRCSFYCPVTIRVLRRLHITSHQT